MTSPVDVAQRALYEAGTRTEIASLDDRGPTGAVVRSFYASCRQQLLRAAQWGFARRTAPLSLLGSYNTTPASSIEPFLFKYSYPQDCIKVRYLFRPWGAVIQGDIAPGVPPTGQPIPSFRRGPPRGSRFLPSTDVDASGQDIKVILTNLPSADAVYTRDVTNPDVWDSLFTEALVQYLAYKFCVPLSGNIKMRADYRQAAQMAILTARAADGNEAISSTDHVPDFIRARGSAGAFPDHSGLGVWAGEDAGFFWGGYDDIEWGA
jgi:hypothetical protein